MTCFRQYRLGRWAGLLSKVLLAFIGSNSILSLHAQDVEEDAPPQPKMVASAARMNILYRGVDNYVEVAVPGVPCEQVQVTITNGEINGSGCLYTIKPGQQPVIWLMSTWSAPHGTDSAETSFRVRSIPLPQACFAGSCEDYDSIPGSHAKAAQGVIARLMDFDFDLYIRIEHYRLQLLRDCTAIFDGVSNEARVSVPMSDALREARVGDTIIISDIRAKYPDGQEVNLTPLHLYVR